MKSMMLASKQSEFILQPGRPRPPHRLSNRIHYTTNYQRSWDNRYIPSFNGGCMLMNTTDMLPDSSMPVEMHSNTRRSALLGDKLPMPLSWHSRHFSTNSSSICRDIVNYWTSICALCTQNTST